MILSKHENVFVAARALTKVYVVKLNEDFGFVP